MLKLSEAIRLGAMLRPQTFGVGTDDNGDCALASAIRAAGCPIRPPGEGDASARDERPGVQTISVEFPIEWNLDYLNTCPECSEELSRFRLIPHLNDKHRWTREQIADLVKICESRDRSRASEPIPQSRLAPV